MDEISTFARTLSIALDGYPLLILYNEIMDSPEIMAWLMQDDPAIRWQVQRDLLGEPEENFGVERARVALEGWGKRLLALQNPTGLWEHSKANGLYSPKWTSTHYTLLELRHLGLPPGNPQALRACALFWQNGLERDGGINLFKSLDYSETCINGMLLAIFSYFKYPDERVHSIAGFLLGEQMADGGWNCQKVNGATHSSFHTTLSVLEGLAEYRQTYPNEGAKTMAAANRAHEFLLLHRLLYSHRTGEVFDPKMMRIHFPPRWRYDFLRVLDYFQSIGLPRDERMADAIQLLLEKRSQNGRWMAYTPWAGRMHFEMEAPGTPSRWNTLRALRVLKWWGKP